MKKHCINLTELSALGNAQLKHSETATDFWTTQSITDYLFNLRGDSNKRHCVSLPGKYHLPFRLDMSVCLDFPALILFIGEGHITFASPEQDNRKIEDIVKPSGKPNQDHNLYFNSLPFGRFVNISVTYNRNEMQILIDGEERFYTCKQAYIKAKNLREINAEGLAIRLAVSKLSTLNIKSITVTEFDEDLPVTRGTVRKDLPKQPLAEHPRPTFESVVAGLRPEFQKEIRRTDRFLSSLSSLKFKRTTDKSGRKITYVASETGVSYVINISGISTSHHFGWYIVYNGKPETWHRRADYFEETLEEIAKSQPLLADRIFYAANDCTGCYGPGCLAKTRYTFAGQKRLTCHGRIPLRMCGDDFNDLRAFFHSFNQLIAYKKANGIPLQEKILLVKP